MDKNLLEKTPAIHCLNYDLRISGLTGLLPSIPNSLIPIPDANGADATKILSRSIRSIYLHETEKRISSWRDRLKNLLAKTPASSVFSGQLGFLLVSFLFDE